MHNDIEKVYFTEEMICRRVRELGKTLSIDYAGKNPLLIGVLKGSFIFLADLARCIDIPCEIEFISASSYGDLTVTSGTVRIAGGPEKSLEGRHVLIVEDILDTGITLKHLVDHLSSLKPASIKICAFLDKPSRRKVPLSADYVGYTCADAFYVGYGLDYAGRYRNLPFIASLKPEIYA